MPLEIRKCPLLTSLKKKIPQILLEHLVQSDYFNFGDFAKYFLSSICLVLTLWLWFFFQLYPWYLQRLDLSMKKIQIKWERQLKIQKKNHSIANICLSQFVFVTQDQVISVLHICFLMLKEMYWPPCKIETPFFASD